MSLRYGTFIRSLSRSFFFPKRPWRIIQNLMNHTISKADIPVLSREDVFRRAAENAESQRFFAFYSSVLQGIVTNEDLMNVPMEDHMVHRGHAVFDTASGIKMCVHFQNRCFHSTGGPRLSIKSTFGSFHTISKRMSVVERKRLPRNDEQGAFAKCYIGYHLCRKKKGSEYSILAQCWTWRRWAVHRRV